MTKIKDLDKFYVTTPIYYVNDVPHIGHAYTTLTADILSRYYQEMLGKENVFYLTGTDEHGQKIAEAAKDKGLSPKEFADSVSPKFKEAWDTLDIKPDFFIRTTDERHEKIASDLLQKIYDNGFIYEGVYEGLYCIGCEKFLTESELVDGKCPLHPNKEPVFQKEKNYFLKLSDLSKKVLEKIKNNEYEILPEVRKNEILSRLESGVSDISISREGVSWGIPVPWDNSQTIYVWVEALMNYYSATQFLLDKDKFWPANLHIVGKDILWFHTVIWQALLIAADLPLPKAVLANGFFTINGQKISKSLGNTISPKEFVDSYGIDGARYLLSTVVSMGNDGDINTEELNKKYNADLANGLGNLVARVAKMAETSDFEFSNEEPTRDKHIDNAIQRLEIDITLKRIWDHVRNTDILLSESKPWEKEGDEKKEILQIAINSIKIIALHLKPFLPKTAEKISNQFSGKKIKSEQGLFPRLQ